MLVIHIFVQDDKKAELSGKADRARDAVAKLTSAIEQMRQSRDEKVANIGRLQKQMEVCWYCIHKTSTYISCSILLLLELIFCFQYPFCFSKIIVFLAPDAQENCWLVFALSFLLLIPYVAEFRVSCSVKPAILVSLLKCNNFCFTLCQLHVAPV